MLSFHISAQSPLPEKFPYPYPKDINYDNLSIIEDELDRNFCNYNGNSLTGFPPMRNSMSFDQTPSFTANSSVPDDIYWNDQFTLPGVEGVIYCMAMNAQGELFIGGTFSVAGTLQTNNIAKWDGEQWQPLGGGVTGAWANIYPSVRALLLDGNDLYVAGEFRYAGNQVTRNVARWDGSQWHVLGNDACNGIGEYVVALAKIDTNLYVGANMTQVCTPEGGSIPANGIARWDGHRWQAVGGDLHPGARVYAMAVIDTILYAGGLIFEAGGQPMSHVATWDGHQWASVGIGVNHVVYSMAVDENHNVYVGGTFTEAGGKSGALYRQMGRQQLVVCGKRRSRTRTE